MNDRQRRETLPQPAETVLVVIGSIHFDVVVQLPHLPRENDRIFPSAMTLAPGGMGGNVAAAFARLGGHSRFAGPFADDADGEALRADLIRDGVDIRWAGTTGVSSSSAQMEHARSSVAGRR